MANLLRRREREAAPLGRGWDPLRTDPFELMRDMLRWDPFRAMSPLLGAPERVFTPDIELKETKDAYVFSADVPGLGENDVDVAVTGNQVTISGKREEEEAPASEQYLCCERGYGNFSRSFTLPGDADAEHLKADLRNGVLHMTIPKKAEMQPKRIPIQSAKQLEQSKTGGPAPRTKAA